MGHGIGNEFEISDDKAIAIAAKMHLHIVGIFAHYVISAMGEPHWHAMAARKLEDAANMILMFMCNHNTSDIGWHHSQASQTTLRFAYCKSAIQHDGSTCRAGRG